MCRGWRPPNFQVGQCYNLLGPGSFQTGTRFSSWCQTQSLCGLGPFAPALNGYQPKWRLSLRPANSDGVYMMSGPFPGICLLSRAKTESLPILSFSAWAWQSCSIWTVGNATLRWLPVNFCS